MSDDIIDLTSHVTLSAMVGGSWALAIPDRDVNKGQKGRGPTSLYVDMTPVIGRNWVDTWMFIERIEKYRSIRSVTVIDASLGSYRDNKEP